MDYGPGRLLSANIPRVDADDLDPACHRGLPGHVLPASKIAMTPDTPTPAPLPLMASDGYTGASQPEAPMTQRDKILTAMEFGHNAEGFDFIHACAAVED